MTPEKTKSSIKLIKQKSIEKKSSVDPNNLKKWPEPEKFKILKQEKPKDSGQALPNPSNRPEIVSLKQPKTISHSLQLPYNIEEVSKNPYYELIKQAFKQDPE